MEEIYERTKALVGCKGIEKLKNSKVLIVGLGGVGGYLAEALSRAGILNLGLCDFDCIDATNLNRQILALNSLVGQPKALLCQKRIAEINPDCKAAVFPFRLSEENLEDLRLSSWDYIADAIDDVPAKIALIAAAKKLNIPIISSMGTGNKLDPFRFKIADISKTHNDPLAKAVRIRLRKEGIEKGVKVLFSDEEAFIKDKKPIPSISYMPGIAGLMIAGEIIQDLLKI